MEQANKKKYESPHLTVVEFRTEQGFATSGGLTATRSSYGNDDGQGDGGNNNQSWFD